MPLHPYTGSNAMSHSHRSGRAATTRAPTFCRAASSGAEGEEARARTGARAAQLAAPDWPLNRPRVACACHT